MSSTALQAAPHQPTSLGSHSPIAASASNRQYNPTSSPSQSRDPYYNQPPTNASPTTSRRPSRRPSGNAAAAPQNNQQTQPQQYYSPTPSVPVSNNNNRAPNSNHASPIPTSALPSMAPGDHQRGVPPVVSPRTSSNRTNAPAGTSRTESSRRQYSNEAANPPRQTGDSQQDREERQRSNGTANGGGEDYAAAARARRRAQTASPESIPHRPSGSREARTQQAQGHPRAQPTTPSALSREASEVLQRVVVSKPEVDIEREQERMAEAIPSSATQTPHSTPGGMSDSPDEPRGTRTRHDHGANKPKNTKFGDYFLGSVLGEGEFGKVRMGWKQEGGVQVAVKLIRKDTVGNNPTRLAKVHREIQILREVTHPNIVRLHEMVETEHKIGIILEYASGGELFDYILNHRYLKDGAARRLFAQLVSGVGYMHKKGIVHRDLKLENLLLDRNRNIIITDFGFANTFNPADELGDEVEYNLSSRDYIKRMELDKVLPNGMRRGDLMQTSCGSPCYAAPELVVSDSLYTGRKVDVWSCGVILYAMLAGYLPFDDDPANPEGDNINLLYKYIVSTPLTFPEYVTPHARDLLRRILVPDPRKRADLFEVARHSWLSEYSHVVGFITSNNTTTAEITNTNLGPVEPEIPGLNRSASVRENKPTKVATGPGDLGRKHGNVDQDAEDHPKATKDNKRRTVQVEYVAPRSQTQRGETQTATAPASGSKTRARSGSQGPVAVPTPTTKRQASVEKPLPRDPVVVDNRFDNTRRPSSSTRQQGMAPPTRPGRDQSRTASETAYNNAPPVSNARPTTGGSMSSNVSRTGAVPLVTRGSYSQPAAPAVAGTNAHGRMSQPPQKKYISSPINHDDLQDEETGYGRPSVQAPVQIQGSGFSEESVPAEQKTHKRSSTIGSIFARTGSIFGGKGKHSNDQTQEKPSKKYPPVSMTNPNVGQDATRPSMDSRRSFSLGFGKKRSGSITGGSQTTLPDKGTRRFSLLPSGGFSLKSIGIGKDEYNNSRATQDEYDDRPDSQRNYDPPQTGRTDQSRGMSMSGGAGPAPQQYTSDGAYDRNRDSPQQDRYVGNTGSPTQARYIPASAPQQFAPNSNFRQDQSTLTTESESSFTDNQNNCRGQYPHGFNESENRQQAPYQQSQRQQPGNNGNRGVLQKPNRNKFNDAYEGDQAANAYGNRQADNAGSSGAARKVMDFFRRRRRDNE